MCLRKSEVCVLKKTDCSVTEKIGGAWYILAALLLYQCPHRPATVAAMTLL